MLVRTPPWNTGTNLWYASTPPRTAMFAAKNISPASHIPVKEERPTNSTLYPQ